MASVCASSAIAAVSSPSSQKNGSIVGATKASFFGGRKLRVSKFESPSSTRSVAVCAAADPERPLWFPGSTPPPWLDGSLPGDFGFDPLGPESLKWNQQAEIVHCRWAMLGAAGIFIPEFLTKIGILNTPSWYTAGELDYFTDTTTLFVIELILIGWAEGRRWADIIKPGSVNTDPIFPNNKLTGTDVGYPGGLWFDPLGWGSGSPAKIKELRTKEIKNGRLAMLAVMGAWFQHIYTGTGPIDNLFAHLADPGHATVFASSMRSVAVCAAADPERPLWFPGSTPPPWLDGSLPGDFGFDPLGLASDPESLKWNQQAEIVHCRWAMLGAAGIFIPEFLTKIGILNTPSWYTAGELDYFTDTTTLFVIELILIGWVEGRRWADIIKPGSVNTDPIFPNNKLTGTDVGYPGGLWFDPLGWGSGSPAKIKELRTKEIKNGRLAMLAVMGAWFQHIYTGTGPIDNLFAHLADPGHATVFAAFSPK